MASPLSLIFFITNCRHESRKSTAPPRRTTGDVRFIVVMHDHQRRPHDHHHTQPLASLSRTATVAVRLVVDFGIIFSAARRRPP
ncbi:hypothetical protein CFC21_083431 [Triticum aestivum]|uniref:Uncharacterized protein n=2 Tax=Triticum aestivum TaxID=4565 RepID=A0A3B6NQ69_WHEAT|nr:hypothetical protein CFC21_083431 [Triticum aestivum]